jgi:hypothetical protein
MHKVVLISKGKRIEQPKAAVPAPDGMLSKGQIAWCRQWIKSNGVPIFAQMQDAVKASRSGVLPIGEKAE